MWLAHYLRPFEHYLPRILIGFDVLTICALKQSFVEMHAAILKLRQIIKYSMYEWKIMKRFEIIKVDAEIQQPTEQTYFLESQVSKPVVGGSYVNKKIILCFLAALSIGMGVHVALATMAIGIPDADVPVSTAKNSSIRRKYNQEANEPEDINAKKPAYAQANSVLIKHLITNPQLTSVLDSSCQNSSAACSVP